MKKQADRKGEACLLVHRLIESRQRCPNRLAVVCDEHALTYEEFASLVSRVASGLSSFGLDSGDRVLVMLKNGIEFAALLFAASDLGLILAPVSPSLTSEAVNRAVMASGATALIGWHAGLARLASDGLATTIPHHRWIAVGGCLGLGCSWQDLIAASASKWQLGLRVGDPCAPYILTMTSGSTGEPKPIILSQKTKLLRSASARDSYGLSETDVILAATPMYHSLAMRLVILPITLGATSVIMQRFTSTAWVDCVRRRKVTFCMLVSSQVGLIVEGLSGESIGIDSLQCLVSSSAFLRSDMKRRVLAELSCRVHECYGTSEVGVLTDLSLGDAVGQAESVGRAVAGVELQIVDPVTGALLQVGEKGEIACRSEMICSGYAGHPDAWSKALRNNWFHTGDIGSIDKNGFLYFHGRLKEIIITGGINVYPKDVEDCISSHPWVHQVAVIGIDDERLGEAVFAVIVVEKYRELTERDLRSHSARYLADFQQPVGYAFVDSLPVNLMGKVDKLALSERYKLARPGERIHEILRPKNMSRSHIRKVLIDLLCHYGPVLGACASEQDECAFLDVGLIDSFNLLAFVIAIEDEFRITLDPNDLQSREFRTVGGLVGIIAAKVQR